MLLEIAFPLSRILSSDHVPKIQNQNSGVQISTGLVYHIYIYIYYRIISTIGYILDIFNIDHFWILWIYTPKIYLSNIYSILNIYLFEPHYFGEVFIRLYLIYLYYYFNFINFFLFRINNLQGLYK